jgi:hypothetical protein
MFHVDESYDGERVHGITSQEGTMRSPVWGKRSLMLCASVAVVFLETGLGEPWTLKAGNVLHRRTSTLSQPSDSLQNEPSSPQLSKVDTLSRSAWGVDILLSNNGFGLGTFYRREFTQDLSGLVTFSLSESKDDREMERFDPYLGISYVPGKLNRFLVLPLMVGVQYRLFREDIMDSFRPYVNAGVGPTMIFSSPYTEITELPGIGFQTTQVDFFKSLGRGQAHYTAGAFLGLGAVFGTERSNFFGLSIRYYFTYLFGDGLPSLYNSNTGGVAGTKKEFGGFFIAFNFGVGY